MRSQLIAICMAQLSLISIVDARRPNVVVIFTDDHGWTDLGIQDIREDLKTPHIDAMATKGLRMTNGYVTAPQCVPSRAGLLTGKSQNRFGDRDADQFDRRDLLHAELCQLQRTHQDRQSRLRIAKTD
ncbi:sulfatase-like hydrolase/transferase [Planctomycetaceae bacterium]|nr:sulfatase-like hydrolase/transferase [Planctomycetaceae bacterium]